MTETIFVALMSLVGTLIGSVSGILAANKLTNYRIDKIEDRLNMMDSLDKRIHNLETHNEVQDERIESIKKETERNTEDIKGMK